MNKSVKPSMPCLPTFALVENYEEKWMHFSCSYYFNIFLLSQGDAQFCLGSLKNSRNIPIENS